MTQSIGFIGASGLMGHGMAKNLRARGHPLAITVHRNRERVADLLAAGATEVDSPAALARQCDIVFICVTGSPQVEASVTGDRGLLAGARAGLVIVDCSTSEPESTTRLRERAAAMGVTYIDARGNTVEQPANIVVLATYCFNNTRLLLLSGIATELAG